MKTKTKCSCGGPTGYGNGEPAGPNDACPTHGVDARPDLWPDDERGTHASEAGALRPCPFCGGTNVTWMPRANTTGCDDCNIYVSRIDKSEAVTAWNRRAGAYGTRGQRDDIANDVDDLNVACLDMGNWTRLDMDFDRVTRTLNAATRELRKSDLKDEESARAYMTRLLLSIAPNVEPLPSLLGIATQIDNAICGLKGTAANAACGTQREQIAEAICEALSVTDGTIWPLLADYDRKQYLHAADAVIALRAGVAFKAGGAQ